MHLLTMKFNTITEKQYKLKCVLYCRVSTKEQAEEGNSLATQERLCKEYAVKNNFEIAKIFIERGESAKTQDRKVFQELLAYCTSKKNQVSIVVAYKIDRISRNTDDYGQIRLQLKRYGIEIKSTTEYFENTPAGRFMESIIANVAQFDNDVRTERSVGGSKEAMREGRYVWRAPIGYENIKVGGKSTIVLTDKAPIVKKMFELVAQNIHHGDAIRSLMINEGLIGKMARPVARSYFYRLLKNKVYAGWIVKFGEQVKGTFEPLISEDLFNVVQLILKRRGHSVAQYTIDNPDFPLRRFVFHPDGDKITGSWSTGRVKKYPYYRFPKRNGLSFTKDSLESAFASFLDNYRLTPDHFENFKQLVKDTVVKKQKLKNRQRDNLEKQIQVIKQKQNLLFDQNFNCAIPEVIFKQQLQRLQEDYVLANSKLLSLPTAYLNLDKLIVFIRKFMMYPGQTWKGLSNNNKIKLQWFQFPKGVTITGLEFETREISNICKLKETILPELSSTVPTRDKIWNQQKKVNKYTKQAINSPTANKHSIYNGNSEDQYWEMIVEEMQELHCILTGKPTKKELEEKPLREVA